MRALINCPSPVMRTLKPHVNQNENVCGRCKSSGGVLCAQGAIITKNDQLSNINKINRLRCQLIATTTSLLVTQPRLDAYTKQQQLQQCNNSGGKQHPATCDAINFITQMQMHHLWKLWCFTIIYCSPIVPVVVCGLAALVHTCLGKTCITLVDHLVSMCAHVFGSSSVLILSVTKSIRFAS